MDPCDKQCAFDFSDRNKTVIRCNECNRREVLRPETRAALLAELDRTHRWVGPPVSRPTSDTRSEEAPAQPASPPPPPPPPLELDPDEPAPRRPAPRPATSPGELTTYESFDGQKVELTVKMFQLMLCPDASEMMARYGLAWCHHNRIDPFSGEAYFSVMDGKLVIQVSKDCWFRRVEANPRFVAHRSGLIVETSLQTIKEAILGGLDDYQIAPQLRDKLLADFVEGKALEPKGISARLRVKKNGLFLDKGEELIGAWAEVEVKDRPHPYRFEVDKKGWQTVTSKGESNVFWERKGPWMAAKGALKNCCRLAFPHLAGLMSRPELGEEEPTSDAAVPARS